MKEGSGSFLKKRTKKLFPLEPSRLTVAHTKWKKVFWFFFSKKNRFLPLHRRPDGRAAAGGDGRGASPRRHQAALGGEPPSLPNNVIYRWPWSASTDRVPPVHALAGTWQLRHAVRIACCLACLTAGSAQAQKSADTLRITWRDPTPSLDPTRTARRSRQILALQIFDTLVYRDPDTLQTKPLIAASWRVVDENTVDFTLRTDLRFSNGAPVTVDDVAYSIAIATGHAEAEPIAGFTALAGADIIDPQHIRIHFTQGVQLGLEYLAMLLPILPRDYRTRVGDAEFAQTPIGSGPYRGHRSATGTIFLDRNEQYPADLAKGRAAIAHLEFRTAADSGSEVADLINHRADWIWDFDPDQLDAINAVPALQGLRADSLRFGYLSITPRGDTPFADRLVRQAIFHAIDRAALARRFGTGSLRQLNAPCYPTQFGCDQSAAARYDTDPALARRLLADAGYAKGFTATLVSSLLPAWGSAVQSDLRAIGIDVAVRQVPPEEASGMAKRGETLLQLGAWGSGGINDVAAVLPHFFGGGPADHTGDTRLHDILASAPSADPDHRRQADQAAIHEITAQAYMLPLNIVVDTYAFSRDVAFRLPPDNLPRFYQASWR